MRDPASSGRAAVADGGSLAPVTCEKLTPPRSNTLPSSITRAMPPPPSGRVHSSRAEGLPVQRFELADDPRLQARK